MAVDLKTFEKEMKDGYKEVTSEKVPTDWALFGYDGQSNTLKLTGTGEDGITELVEDFNPSKVQYAFLRVEDPKTSLPKFVLINWQGETAPGSRKGACALHLRDVERFFAGHHITMSVRNEDELDLSQIQEKLVKASSTSYNFKEKPKGMELSPKPVGTAYKKIVPSAELPNIQIRESFWQKDQNEEKKRILAEREKVALERKGADLERRKREEKENRLREEQIKERERQIANQREQEKDKSSGREEEAQDWEEQRRADREEATERARRSEVMRKERNQEAQELIRQGGNEAKKVFQRNSSQGQMNFSSPRSSISSQPVPITIPKDIRENEESNDDIAPPPPAFDNGRSAQLEENEKKKKEEERRRKEEEEEEVNQRKEEGVHHASLATVSIEPDEGSQEEDKISPGTNGGYLESYGVCAVALYDYQASDETEISFDPGQIISHIDQIDPGWWQGLGPHGNYGLFPANYVEIIDNQELQIM